MSQNASDEAEETCEEEESFHIYVLSFLYGLLAVRGTEMIDSSKAWAWRPFCLRCFSTVLCLSLSSNLKEPNNTLRV